MRPNGSPAYRLPGFVFPSPPCVTAKSHGIQRIGKVTHRHEPEQTSRNFATKVLNATKNNSVLI